MLTAWHQDCGHRMSKDKKNLREGQLVHTEATCGRAKGMGRAHPSQGLRMFMNKAHRMNAVSGHRHDCCVIPPMWVSGTVGAKPDW